MQEIRLEKLEQLCRKLIEEESMETAQLITEEIADQIINGSSILIVQILLIYHRSGRQKLHRLSRQKFPF